MSHLIHNEEKAHQENTNCRGKRITYASTINKKGFSFSSLFENCQKKKDDVLLMI